MNSMKKFYADCNNQKSELHLLQCHCLLFLPILNIPNIAVCTALEVLVIFFVFVEWQYGHSTVGLSE